MPWARKLEHAVCRSADGAWRLLQRLNRLGSAPPAFRPQWSDSPIPRHDDRSLAPTGWPRETDSLCPKCVKEIRGRIADGDQNWQSLLHDKPGELRAHILQRGGRIVMEKTCPKHGFFEDVLSVDPAFYARMERLAPARDVCISPDSLHDHGSSTMKYGRGGVLTVDLTNRCNMMCDTCFMDANQAGHVYELSWDETKRILDDALGVRPRRQMSVQLSGGEPTISPHFLDAIRYSRELGYFCVQCATNGVRFATEPGFAARCKEAGLRLAYLQFDGVTNEAHAHRNVGNLHDVKLRAIEELHAAGIDVVLVVTVKHGVNDDQVGPIVQFAVENADKITVVSFQPISFTGRDEDVSDEERQQQRYTLSHLVHDIHKQTGWTDPLSDWFPLSALAPFGDVVDLMDGPAQPWGHLKCACHPHCGTGTVLFVNKRTKQMVPLTDFVDMAGLLSDITAIFDAGRNRLLTQAQLVASLLRHYQPHKAPPGFSLTDALRQFLSQTGAAHAGEEDAAEYDWRVLFVAGMWFQDLYNYDFRRTEMCIIPHGTPEGEISFCALNTGIGWRQVVEQANAKASTADWYREHGRHAIYAGGRDIVLPEGSRPASIRQHSLTEQERLRAAGGNGRKAKATGANGRKAKATGANGRSTRAGGGGNGQGQDPLFTRAVRRRRPTPKPRSR